MSAETAANAPQNQAGTAQGERVVTVDEVHRLEAKHIISFAGDWCRHCKEPWPCVTKRLIESRDVLRGQLAEALELLGLMYSKYENGDPCYYDPENSDGYLGAAVRMEDDEEARVLAALAALDPSGQRGRAR